MKDYLKKFHEATLSSKKLQAAVLGKSIVDLEDEYDKELLFDDAEKIPLDQVIKELRFTETDDLLIKFFHVDPSKDPKNPWKFQKLEKVIRFSKEQYLDNRQLVHLLCRWFVEFKNSACIGPSDAEFIKAIRKKMCSDESKI